MRRTSSNPPSLSRERVGAFHDVADHAAFQNACRCIARRKQRLANFAGLFVHAIAASPVTGDARTMGQRKRAIDGADDFGKGNLVGRPEPPCLPRKLVRIPVLHAQRMLYSAWDQLGQIKLVRLQAIVALYKAMGGGWTDPAHGTALVQK